MQTSINPSATPTEKALGRAYLEFSENFTRLETFDVVATAGIDAGLPAVEALLRTSLDEVLDAYRHQVPDPGALEALMRETVRKSKRADTELAIHAATVVFAHAVLEKLLHDLIRILGTTLVSQIAARLPDRKVRLADIRAQPTDQLEARIVDEHINSLTRDSLEKNLAFLFDICGFRADCQSDGYQYDQATLLQLDRHRQDLLHHRVLEAGHADPPLNLQFVQYTGFFLISLVAARLGATVDLLEMLRPYLPVKGSA